MINTMPTATASHNHSRELDGGNDADVSRTDVILAGEFVAAVIVGATAAMVALC